MSHGSSKIAVLGAGSWGTALADHLARAGRSVTLWGRDEVVIDSISSHRINSRYFPGIPLSPQLGVTRSLKDTVEGATLIVVAVPSSAVREIAQMLQPLLASPAIILSAVKGLEPNSLKRTTEVLAEELATSGVAVLAGPSFAREVLIGLPTAVTVASHDMAVARYVSEQFHHGPFRVYCTTDQIGAELAGVMKNVIALAAGVVDGMELGSNARAALVTRGLAEMRRFVVAFGGNEATVAGLSGLGDLLLTATGELSRNRQVGIGLGEGKPLDQILISIGQVAEAVMGTDKILDKAKPLNLNLPIAEEVSKILAGTSAPADSMRRLLARAPALE